MKLEADEWFYVIIILCMFSFLGIYQMIYFIQEEEVTSKTTVIERPEGYGYIQAETAPRQALTLPRTPETQTFEFVPDLQEEALNKMGLTKHGGAKPDLSGRATPTSIEQ